MMHDVAALDAASNALILALLRDRDSYRLCYLAALDKLSEDARTIARLREHAAKDRAFHRERYRTHLFMAWLCAQAAGAQEARDEIRRYARRVFDGE